MEGLHAADELHPRRRLRRRRAPVLAGRAATPRSRGTRTATRTCRARCSTAARRGPNNPDESSAFYVFRSTGTNGASWNFPARPAAELNDTAGSGASLLDKPLHDDRRQQRRPLPGPHLRDLDPVRGGRDGLHLRGLLARLRRELQHAAARQHRRARCARTRSASRRRRAPATRTSSPSRSSGADGTSTSSATTTTSPACGPARTTTRRRRRPRPATSTTARRCCSPSRPTAASSFSAPVRSPTTTTCPTARPTRGGPGRGLRAREGRAPHNSIFRAANYPSGGVNPQRPERDRRHLRLLHQPALQRAQRLRAAGLQPGHVPAALRRGSRRRARATTTSCSAARPTAARRSPGRPTNVRTLPVASRGNDHQRRPVLAVGRVRPQGPPRGLLLRPRVRQRRDNRLLRHQPVRERATARTSPPGG